MRVGQNPLKYRPIPSRPDVVASVITHLPDQEGYHAHRLEIVKLSLTSMREFCNAHILIWDNGSCAELTDWLVDEYKPDTLILSPNVGKSSAVAAIFRMFPPETVIALADDIIQFFPYCLSAQLQKLHI